MEPPTPSAPSRRASSASTLERSFVGWSHLLSKLVIDAIDDGADVIRCSSGVVDVAGCGKDASVTDRSCRRD